MKGKTRQKGRKESREYLLCEGNTAGLGEGKEGAGISRMQNILTAVLCIVLLPWKEMDLVGTGAKGVSHHPAHAASIEGNSMVTTRSDKKGLLLG